MLVFCFLSLLLRNYCWKFTGLGTKVWLVPWEKKLSVEVSNFVPGTYLFYHDGQPEHLVSVHGHSLFGDRTVTASLSTTTGGCTTGLAYITLLWYLVDTLLWILYFSVLLITAALSAFVQPHNSTPVWVERSIGYFFFRLPFNFICRYLFHDCVEFAKYVNIV